MDEPRLSGLSYHARYKNVLLAAVNEEWLCRYGQAGRESFLADLYIGDNEEEVMAVEKAMDEEHSAIIDNNIPVVRRLIRAQYDSWNDGNIDREKAEAQRYRNRDEAVRDKEEELYYKKLDDAESIYWRAIVAGYSDLEAGVVSDGVLEETPELNNFQGNLFTASDWIKADENLVYLINHASQQDLVHLKDIRAEWIRLALVSNRWLCVFSTKEAYGKVMQYEINYKDTILLMDKYRTYDNSTNKIKETDLTEAEKTFIDGLLELFNLNFDYGGMGDTLGECLYFLQSNFYDSLNSLAEAEASLRSAPSGEIAEAESNLIGLQTEFKNDIVRLERNLNIANELNEILDIAFRVVSGRHKEYSDKVIALKNEVREAIVNLKKYLADGEKEIAEINRKQDNS